MVLPWHRETGTARTGYVGTCQLRASQKELYAAMLHPQKTF